MRKVILIRAELGWERQLEEWRAEGGMSFD